MAIEEVQSNGADYASGLPSSQKVISLRKYTSDDPLTWNQNDNNFEILRATLNDVISTVNAIDTSSLVTQVASLDSQLASLDTQVASERAFTNDRLNILEGLTLDTRLSSIESDNITNKADISSLNQHIAEIKTEHVARTYVRNHVLIKWKTTTTQSQKDEVTTALGLVYDSDVPLTSFKKYLLPLDGRSDAGIVVPILSLHEYVDIADYNGTSASY
jgi:hypothetical protein